MPVALKTPTLEQEKMTLGAACIVLRFLTCPDRQSLRPPGLKALSESACLHRLYDLTWLFRDSEVLQMLNKQERIVAAEFTQLFESLPWRPIEATPHISELSGHDFSVLIPVARRLLPMLESRKRFAGLRRFGRCFREALKWNR